MEIILKNELIGRLSSKGVLAYIAVMLAGGTEATTASLAGLVRCQTVVMLEGLKELSVEASELVAKAPKNKWRCGVVAAGAGVLVQNLDSDKYREFVDDLKKFWDNLNPTLAFQMGRKDGAQIRRFLADHIGWTEAEWRAALVFRKISIVKYGNASRSAPLWTWVGRLDEYAAGPLNKFGKPAEEGGKHNDANETRQRNREAVARAIANA